MTVRALTERHIFEDCLARVLRRFGPVHMAAGGDDLLFIGLQIEVEMFERMVLDVPRPVAQGVELGQGVNRFLALVDEANPHIAEGLLQLSIGKRAASIFLEGGGGDIHQAAPPHTAAAPHRFTLSPLPRGEESPAPRCSLSPSFTGRRCRQCG